LKEENGRLKRAIADLTPDKLILNEARAMIENYRQEYNKIKPNFSLNYMAPESFILYQITKAITWYKIRGLDRLENRE
jgi:hypothetical protein